SATPRASNAVTTDPTGKYSATLDRSARMTSPALPTPAASSTNRAWTSPSSAPRWMILATTGIHPSRGRTCASAPSGSVSRHPARSTAASAVAGPIARAPVDARARRRPSMDVDDCQKVSKGARRKASKGVERR
ncbi:hypothetical protein BE221DRAFT_50095, partial [Ostreococcus tauri]